MRWLVLLSILSACAQAIERSAAVGVSFLPADAAEIPFRTGGPFATVITVPEADVGPSSRALVSIVATSLPAGAITSAMITLTDSADGNVRGIAALSWPIGGPHATPCDASEPQLQIHVQLGDTDKLTCVPLEQPTVTIQPGRPTDTGAQVLQSVCVDSSSADGMLEIRLAGASLKESGTATGTVPLIPGACADPTASPAESSFARFTVVVSQPGSSIVARLVATDAMDHVMLGDTSATGLALQFAPTALTRPALSVVTINVTATTNMTLAKGIAVTFVTVPPVPIVPASGTTNNDGIVTTSFQIPEAGQVRVEARAGDASDAVTFTAM